MSSSLNLSFGLGLLILLTRPVVSEVSSCPFLLMCLDVLGIFFFSSVDVVSVPLLSVMSSGVLVLECLGVLFVSVDLCVLVSLMLNV